MFHFCTLFDSRFLTRGLALYESLLGSGEDFQLYVFAFDDKCHEILKRLSLEKITAISLNEFEDEDLLAAKATRSRMEYCWTCTPSVIRYALDKFGLPTCTYIDADLYFYNSPQPLFDEMAGHSVLITEHRYTRRYDQSRKSGKYCVQFMAFRNDARARQALEWWRAACNAWCYARHEGGKFGDQKYLDDWTERFEGVHVLEHLGGGLAPWNTQQYEFSQRNERIVGRSRFSGREFDPIFYHFHHVTLYTNGQVDLSGYRLSPDVKALFYRPYLKHLCHIAQRLSALEDSPDVRGEVPLRLDGLRARLRRLKHYALSNIVIRDKFLASQ